jgi:hypothetical protein
VGGVLAGIGVLLLVVGSVMLLWAAFSESLLWGLGCLFVPFVGLIFIVKHWSVAKRGFLVQVVGLVFFFAGGAMVPDTPTPGASPDAAPVGSVLRRSAIARG